VTFYIVRRVAVGIVLLLLMSFIFFVLTVITPGRPIATGENPKVHEQQVCNILHYRGLVDEHCHDYPIWIRYPTFMNQLVFHGNLGDSYINSQPVTTLIAQRLPNSILLYGLATVLAVIIGVPLGVLAATRQYSFFDALTSTVSYIGYSTPSFVLGIFLLLILGVWVKQFDFPGLGHVGLPLFGMHSGGEDSLPDLAVHLILPTTALAVLSIAQFSRFMRASLLEVLHQDYIRTARAKGLPGFKVNYKHALRNAVIPLITIVALSAPVIVQGAIITEGIFSWPGIGQLAFQSSVDRDYPVIMAVVMIVAVTTVIFNLLADIAYAVVDPRIRY
jgi:peptide/nickel transport system permease protein